MVISLTTTADDGAPASGALPQGRAEARFHRWSDDIFQTALADYRLSLTWVLNHKLLMLLVLMGTGAMNVWLFTIIPEGFFPEQDTGRMFGFIQADQSISFQRISGKLRQYATIIQADKDVDDVVGFTGAGGGGGNSGKDVHLAQAVGQRKVTTEQIMARLRPKLAQVPDPRSSWRPCRRCGSAGG